MSLPTLFNGSVMIVLDIEMNDIFEKFGFYIDPKYLGYLIPQDVWKKIIKEFEDRGFPKIQQLLYQRMLEQRGDVRLQLEVPYDCI